MPPSHGVAARGGVPRGPKVNGVNPSGVAALVLTKRTNLRDARYLYLNDVRRSEVVGMNVARSGTRAFRSPGGTGCGPERNRCHHPVLACISRVGISDRARCGRYLVTRAAERTPRT